MAAELERAGVQRAQPARPGIEPARLDRPRATHFARLGRPGDPARPTSIDLGAGATPRDPLRHGFRRFRVDFATDFRRFSMLHRASDSTRSAKGRTSVFAGMRSTSEGSQTLRQTRKSTRMLQPGRAKKTRFPRSRTRLGVDFGRLGALLGAPGRSFWCPGAALGIAWAALGPAGDAPRRSRDTPETPSGRSWTPRGVPRVSWDRFRVDLGCPGASFGKDLDRCSRRLSPLGRLDLASQRHD